MKLPAFLLSLFLLAGCVSNGVRQDNLGEIAADYVQMTLEIGEREPGYVDAYYGPKEWQDAAKAAPRSLADLAEEARRLTGRVNALKTDGLDATSLRRRDFLLAQLTAATTRLRMLQGEKLSFAEEAKGLFGVTPELKELSAYDPILARIETLVPGTGPLSERVDAFQDRFTIPKDRLKPVFDAAIAECRRRTAVHIAMPANESFKMEFVTGKSWSGYNYYQGNAHSLIQINTDLPIRISRAVDLGCHEGYPGHHALNMLLEERLTKGKGWIEFSVYPLYSPQSLIAEGSANYGIDLAFPGPERLAFETRALYPLAGIPTADAAKYLELLKATSELAGARFTIARDFLEGRIDRAKAVELTQKYQLVSKARAEQSIDFTTQYRSYVINYGLGQDMVRTYVEAAGPSSDARWKRMEEVISEPTLPNDLLRR
ncbi:hypothetical protein IC614_08940 [Allosphingosinicella flava]|uniref:DUF885 domain-containing protein n=1 Tax=Allosphingosinicella flava TaxID=2771430 RepID=A0A7T2GIG4_9SPHN|nr:hypothetical protein [Sphingosinicella flava]QPQ54462.1 hypothetical protein IC614_08940 [Sphingosinicella flava]